MALLGVENAWFSNIKDLLDMVAESGSPGLVKKLIKLDGLVQCFQKAASQDPDVVGAFFDQLKGCLDQARTVKKEEAERKRAEREEEKEKQKEKGEGGPPVAKKLKRSHTRHEGIQAATMTIASGTQNEETNVAPDALENGGNRTVQNRPTATSDAEHATSAGSDFEDDSSNEEESDSLVDSINEPPGTTESIDSNSPAVTQQSVSQPALSEPDHTRDSHDAHLSPTSIPSLSTSTEAGLSGMNSSAEEVHRGPSSVDIAHAIVASAGKAADPVGQVLPLAIPGKATSENTSMLVGQTYSTVSQKAQEPTSGYTGLPRLMRSSNTTTLPVKPQNQALVLGSKRRKEVVDLETQITNQIWPKFAGSTTLKNRDHDIAETLTMFERLNFWTVQWRILKFADKRLRMPGPKAEVSQLTDKCDPIAVFHSIEASSATEADAKLHRIHGQVELVNSIQRKVDNNYQPKESLLLPRTLKSEYPKFFRQEMADSITEGESKEVKRKTRTKLDNEYKAGKRWLEAIKTFEGSGILFLFVFTGESSIAFSNPRARPADWDLEISCYALSQTYTKFQRACVKHVFTQNASLIRLASCFEKNALEKFCREGCIDKMSMDRIRVCEGPAVAVAEAGDDTEEE
ncbi:MAG: hypothetical protein Q9173_005609 [Seirophora scorigena]